MGRREEEVLGRGEVYVIAILHTHFLILLILQISFGEQALNFKCLHTEKSFRVTSAPQYSKIFIQAAQVKFTA